VEKERMLFMKMKKEKSREERERVCNREEGEKEIR
jgi:hypothetical protein